MSKIGNLQTLLYPDCCAQVEAGTLSLEESQSVALEFVTANHPGAVCGFLFGSSTTGHFKPYSDLDLVIVLPRIAMPELRREVFRGVPIEAHIVDPVSFDSHLALAVSTGVPNFTLMLPKPLVVCDPIGEAQRFLIKSQEARQNGPQPVNENTRNMLRTNIGTSLLELDLNSDPTERFAMATALFSLVMAAHLAVNQQWLQPRKWAVRSAPDFAHRLELTIMQALGGDLGPVIDLACKTLEPWGGPVWLGSHPIPTPDRLAANTLSTLPHAGSSIRRA